MKSDNLFKNIVVNFASKILIQGLAFLSSIILARISGASVLGNISLAVAFQNVFNNTLSASVGNAHLKLYNENPNIGIRTFAWVAFLLRSAIAILVLIIVGILLFTKSTLYSHIQLYLIVIFLIQTIIGAIVITSNFVYAAKLKAYKSNISNIIQSVLLSSFRIVAVYWGYKEYGIANALNIASVLSIIYPYLQLRREGWGTFDKKLAKRYFTMSFKMLSGALCFALVLSFDKMSLGGFIKGDSSVQLGYYAAGSSLGLMFLSLGTSMGGVFLAVFSKNKGENIAKNFNILGLYERVLSLIVFPVFLLILVFSEEVIRLVFGAKYLSGNLIFIFSLLHAYIKTQNIPLINVYFSLDMFKKYNLNNLLYAISIIVVIIAMGYFNPLHSEISSVSLGVLLTAVVERLLYIVNLKNKELSRTYLNQLPITLLFLAFFIGLKFAVYYFQLNEIQKITMTLGSFLTLILVLILAKVYKKDDIQLAKKIVSRDVKRG
jgi:O-antigen/teichoic acid export membrane protein